MGSEMCVLLLGQISPEIPGKGGEVGEGSWARWFGRFRVRSRMPTLAAPCHPPEPSQALQLPAEVGQLWLQGLCLCLECPFVTPCLSAL